MREKAKVAYIVLLTSSHEAGPMTKFPLRVRYYRMNGEYLVITLYQSALVVTLHTLRHTHASQLINSGWTS